MCYFLLMCLILGTGCGTANFSTGTFTRKSAAENRLAYQDGKTSLSTEVIYPSILFPPEFNFKHEIINQTVSDGVVTTHTVTNTIRVDSAKDNKSARSGIVTAISYLFTFLAGIFTHTKVT